MPKRTCDIVKLHILHSWITVVWNAADTFSALGIKAIVQQHHKRIFMGVGKNRMEVSLHPCTGVVTINQYKVKFLSLLVNPGKKVMNQLIPFTNNKVNMGKFRFQKIFGCRADINGIYFFRKMLNHLKTTTLVGANLDGHFRFEVVHQINKTVFFCPRHLPVECRINRKS